MTDPVVSPKPVQAQAVAPLGHNLDAEKLLQEIAAEKVQVQVAADTGDDDKWQYVHYCRRGHPAFFYEKNPKGRTVLPGEWFSRYKRLTEPWMGVVICQECSKYDGQGYLTDEFPVQVTYQPGPKRETRFMPHPRFVYRYPKSKELRRTIVPHRAEMSDISAANVGVPNPDFPLKVRDPRAYRELQEIAEKAAGAVR